MAKYNQAENLLSSVTSNGGSVRVVFTLSSGRVKVEKLLELVYQTLSPGKVVFTFLVIVKVLPTSPYLTL